MSFLDSIFCCANAAQVNVLNSMKLHYDPNRAIHGAIFESFIRFASRRQIAATPLSLVRCVESGGSSSSAWSPSKINYIFQQATPPVLTSEDLQNNPITSNTPYTIHLTTRLDFGPVLSHRYFVCPSSLHLDWIEVTLGQWFAAGSPFSLKAEKWNMKCWADSTFYHLTLRPNLSLRFPLAEQQTGVVNES